MNDELIKGNHLFISKISNKYKHIYFTNNNTLIDFIHFVIYLKIKIILKIVKKTNNDLFFKTPMYFMIAGQYF